MLASPEADVRKRQAKRKRQAIGNHAPVHRSAKAVAAIESVFRSTHKREMTAEEREQFRLPRVRAEGATAD